ncbi:molybdopterin cofactor-binding domain-containing protein [Paraburkholderia strydomiana]|uniref:molybdopterin cofactor-binding domain-containing protein n=1 Tax=Paraburkholderia strydomiana TaxID=1245417 RepID=UPI0038BBE6F1
MHAQTAAEAIGVPVERVKVLLGDTALPRAPLAGGSQLAKLLTGAVHKTALTSREQLLALAANDSHSPLSGASSKDLTIEDGRVRPLRRRVVGSKLRSYSGRQAAIVLERIATRSGPAPRKTIATRRIARSGKCCCRPMVASRPIAGAPISSRFAWTRIGGSAV